MQLADVPVVPGTVTPVEDLKSARLVAEEIGFPLMVKASAGGGGRGMRVVRAPGELRAALETAASEAEKAFGDPRVYLEKYIERPRHIEIQVLADDGRTVHLGERECSIQRRHQKLVEEAPSVAVSRRAPRMDGPGRRRCGRGGGLSRRGHRASSCCRRAARSTSSK